MPGFQYDEFPIPWTLETSTNSDPWYAYKFAKIHKNNHNITNAVIILLIFANLHVHFCKI